MASSVTPTQTRYNDPYQNLIFDYNTPDSKVYLSRESNSILKAIGDNVVLKGMDLDPVTFTTTTITTNITAGYAIQDLTLLNFTADATLDMNVSALPDTTNDGCHLAAFINYVYVPTIEATIASLQLFHVAADGTINYPPDVYNSSRFLLLLGLIQFTKVAGEVTAASLYSPTTFTIEGTTYYVKGYNPNNMNLSGLIAGVLSGVTLQGIKDDLLKYDYLMSE